MAIVKGIRKGVRHRDMTAKQKRRIKFNSPSSPWGASRGQSTHTYLQHRASEILQRARHQHRLHALPLQHSRPRQLPERRHSVVGARCSVPPASPPATTAPPTAAARSSLCLFYSVRLLRSSLLLRREHSEVHEVPLVESTREGGERWWWRWRGRRYWRHCRLNGRSCWVRYRRLIFGNRCPA